MRLIDADALVAELKWLQSQVSSTSAMEIAEYIDRINAQPTVDAVVLPFKVGDTVYFADDLWMWPAEIEGIRIRESGVYFEWVQFARSPELTEVWDNGDFDLDDVGKTVFMTREEAEAALSKMKGGAKDA